MTKLLDMNDTDLSNVYADIPHKLPQEVFEDILVTDNIRIERIISYGHSSPDEGWYDQSENEWVIVLKGKGVIEFGDGRIITLAEGDFINIKAGEKHKVLSTAPSEHTVWLAIFYK